MSAYFHSYLCGRKAAEWLIDMKALLQKDFYQLRAYCKSYLLICAVFLGISLAGAGNSNLFFITYPAMLCSLIPVTLQTYDERGKWTSFAGTLPFTHAQLVSAKYLVGLCCSGAVLLLLAAVLLAAGTYSPAFRLLLLGLTLCLSLISPAFCLPFIFRFGTEKGRMAYYVSIGLFFALIYGLADRLGISAADTSSIAAWGDHGAASGMLAAALVCIALYVCSWLVSIRIYERREIL